MAGLFEGGNEPPGSLKAKIQGTSVFGEDDGASHRKLGVNNSTHLAENPRRSTVQISREDPCERSMVLTGVDDGGGDKDLTIDYISDYDDIQRSFDTMKIIRTPKHSGRHILSWSNIQGQTVLKLIIVIHMQRRTCGCSVM
ncbi:hypothetical protein ANN_11740 [Periplaneta americana]|uniref:Uncharacterized protein n=1 Tax=Periplaneta americana TaxID=6978 RepID=A0ABQ8T5W1_PERAM|nr:hypothetical protein ANN_11740 [Periplaneta americana]